MEACHESTLWRRIFLCNYASAPSNSNLGAALTVATASLAFQVALFMFLRTRLPEIYSPRAHLVPERERVPSPPAGLFGWLEPLWTIPNSTIIEKCGLDAYFFLQYLRLQLKIFFPAAVIILPILIPLNTTGNGKKKGLTRQSLSNISVEHADRLWVHLLCAIAFIGWVCYCVSMELKKHVRIRQISQTSPQHRMRASATTVLISEIPTKWCTLPALTDLFNSRFPRGVHTVWINRDCSELAEKVKYRTKIAGSLEDALTALVRRCYRNAQKLSQPGHVHHAQQQPPGGISTGVHEETPHGTGDISSPQNSSTHVGIRGLDGTADGGAKSELNKNRPQHQMDVFDPRSHSGTWIAKAWEALRIMEDPYPRVPSPQPHIGETHELPTRTNKDLKKQRYPVAFNDECDEDQDKQPEWRRYVSPANRQSIRLPLSSWLPSLPFVGDKVDRIYWLRRELARLNLEIEADQRNANQYPYMNSAFIRFNNQADAHLCCQSVIHHLPAAMTPRMVEIGPRDILWENLSMPWWVRELRTGITFIISTGLIVCYAVPITLAGLLSNIATLTPLVPWLQGLNDLPSPVKSAVEGLLPQLVIIVLLTLIPVIFRALLHQQGVFTGSARERGVQVWFFAFMFIQLFFVVTLSTGFVPFTAELTKDSTRIPQSLASSIPPAAEYFFTYLTVQALNNSAMNLLNPVDLLSKLVLAKICDTTAHEKWRRQTEPNTIAWGSFFPLFTNFAAVGLVYSIQAPLILVFMLLIFGVFWTVYRYNILFVYRSVHDTGGLLFPVALKQMFTGLYILMICLIGQFLAVEHSKCLPQAIIMALVLIGTASCQYHLNQIFDPLFKYLPGSLEEDALMREEQWARASGERHLRTEADILYSNYVDELEDLTPGEREEAVRSAFQPEALRATRPVVWIPRDPLGVGDDEIRRAGKMSEYVWISNQGATLDAKGRVDFSTPPPDFSSRDLIVL